MGGLAYWPESSPCPSLALSDKIEVRTGVSFCWCDFFDAVRVFTGLKREHIFLKIHEIHLEAVSPTS